MKSKRGMTLLTLAFAAVVFTIAPRASADEWDKKTVVTFADSVEVPGKVLAPGTYVFKLADVEGDRQLVQIFNADQSKLVTTVMAIPDYRLNPTDNTAISFEERPSGRPEAVRDWFYPGDNNGVAFVYPKSDMLMASTPEPAAPVPPVAATEPAPAPPAPTPVVVVQQEEVVAEAVPAEPVNSTPTTLPHTAGNFMLLPLLGLGLLGAGSTVLRLARERS